MLSDFTGISEVSELNITKTLILTGLAITLELFVLIIGNYILEFATIGH